MMSKVLFHLFVCITSIVLQKLPKTCFDLQHTAMVLSQETGLLIFSTLDAKAGPCIVIHTFHIAEFLYAFPGHAEAESH